MRILKNIGTIALISVALIYSISPAAGAAGEAVVETVLVDQLTKTEGIAACPNGKVFTVENGTGRILQILSDKKAEMFFQASPGAAGLACDSKNRLFLAEYSKSDVLMVSSDGKKGDVYASGFKTPNGITVGPDDVVYVSDSDAGTVTAIRKDGVKEVMLSGISFANGLAIGDEGAVLYVAQTLSNKVFATPVSGDNKGKKKTVSKELKTVDGIAISPEGVLYACLFTTGELARLGDGGKVEIAAKGLQGPANPLFINGAIYVTNMQGKGLSKIKIAE